MNRLIWWLWTAFDPVEPHTLDVLELWNCEDDYGPDPDVAWLGEGAWIGITDNMGLGLR